MTRLQGSVEKGWGSEEIWVSNNDYCSKLMHFNEGAKFSMHFHSHKRETWRIMSGKFLIKYIQTSNAQVFEYEATEGMIHHNEPLVPHQVICLEAGIILEVSTPDSVEDNYRVLPGDSQK
jgi:mannose-6-phosphate isomerase-like protein (cupin superfamily)